MAANNDLIKLYSFCNLTVKLSNYEFLVKRFRLCSSGQRYISITHELKWFLFQGIFFVKSGYFKPISTSFSKTHEIIFCSLVKYVILM